MSSRGGQGFEEGDGVRGRLLSPFTLSLLIAGAAVLVFIHLIANYWAYYAIGSSGSNGLALIGVVAPVAGVLFFGSAAGIYYLGTRLGLAQWRRALLAAAAVITVFIALFAGEVWRTNDYPTERPKRLSEFLASYFGAANR
jgi:uncharacterized BrkB/YihY/UPF0761 family membrane protein